MPTIELILLFILIGAATGAISSIIKIAPTLIAIPTLYFFLPVFSLSLQDLMLPAIATCITAFIPTHLYAWIKSMKHGEVDSQHLINFAPGIAMGGVIGAQLLSLASFLVFKIGFTLIALIAILNIILRSRTKKTPSIAINKLGHIPIGLFIGTMSLVSGNCGHTLGESLSTLKAVDQRQRQGSINGFVVFASIAAMVGFIFPAQSFDQATLSGFSGAIHVPLMLVLAFSHLFFYWLCRNRGNTLDKSVLSISFVIFVTCSLVRLWV
tara:strand:- start:50661 stop:51461 length:801 start_codon:yes stop_codon:yes gene_type:complete